MNKPDAPQVPEKWEREVNRRLSLFGHRNWVVIADAAFPAQSDPGIETIAVAEDQVQVVRTVLGRIADCKHIRPSIYTDLELGFVEEEDAPGVAEFRHQLHALLDGECSRQLAHAQLIVKLDQSAQVFKILVIKTASMIPYTSVFIELDCGYWNTAAEKRLRDAMPG